MSKILLNNFVNGEISPKYQGSVNLEAYRNSCKELTNFVVGELGGISRRPPITAKLHSINEYLKFIPFGDELATTEYFLGLSVNGTDILKIEGKNIELRGTSPLQLSLEKEYVFLDEKLYTFEGNNILIYSLINEELSVTTGESATTTFVVLETTDEGKSIGEIKKNTYFILKAKGIYERDNDIFPNVLTSDWILNDFGKDYNGFEPADFNREQDDNHTNITNHYICLCKAINDIPTNTLMIIPTGLHLNEPPDDSYLDRKFDTTNAGVDRLNTYLDTADVKANSEYISIILKSSFEQLGVVNTLESFFISTQTSKDLENGQTYLFRLPNCFNYSDPMKNNITPIEGLYTKEQGLIAGTLNNIANSVNPGFLYNIYLKCSSVTNGVGPSSQYRHINDYNKENDGDILSSYLAVKYSAKLSDLEETYLISEGMHVKVSARFKQTGLSTNKFFTPFIFQNRLGGFSDNIIKASRVNDYTNFTPGENPDDGFLYSLNSNHKIQYVVDNPVMVAGTDQSEFVIQGANGIISGDPSKTAFTQKTNYGSNGIIHKTQNCLLFMSKQRLKNLIYDYNTNSFFGEDLSILSEHLFKAEIKTIVSIRIPQNITFFLTENGKLFGSSFDVVLKRNAFFTVMVSKPVVSMINLNNKLYINTQDDYIEPIYNLSLVDFDLLGIEDTVYLDNLTETNEIIPAVNNSTYLDNVPIKIKLQNNEFFEDFIKTPSNPIPSNATIGMVYKSKLRTSNLIANIDPAYSQGTIKKFGSIKVRCEEVTDFLIGQDDQVLRNATNSTIKKINTETDIELGGTYNEEGTVVIEIEDEKSLKIGGIFVDVDFLGGVQ